MSWILLVFACSLATLQTSAATSKPNVIFILCDDVGWNDVGFHGTNAIRTPNLDALAYSGVILNQHYATPLCSPTRSALLSARHPIHNGMWERVSNASEPYGLSLEEKLLPQYLKDLGYSTHMVGKWHLGFFREAYTPLHRGFDTYFGHWNSKVDYYNHSHYSIEKIPGTTEHYFGYDLHEGLNVAESRAGEYITRMYTERVQKLIAEHDTSKPFFLYLPHTAAHIGNPYAPLQAPQESIDLFAHIADPNRRTFAAMLHELDVSVGHTVQALKDKNMLENSIIVFMSDNGGAVAGLRHCFGNNWPLKGGKLMPWEGGSRVSAFVWSPLLNDTSRVSNELMHVTDWLPTLLGAVHEEPSGNTLPLDGLNVWDSLSDSHVPSARDNFPYIIDTVDNFAALRQGKWKITIGSATYGKFDNWYGQPEREGDYNVTAVQSSLAAQALASTSRPLPCSDTILRLRGLATLTDCPVDDGPACDSRSQEPCLFNLEEDPCERVNLATNGTERISTLKATLDKYRLTMVPSRKEPSDPRSNPALYNNTWVSWYDLL